MSKYQEHLDRLMAAVHLEPVDRVPFVPCSTSVNARLTGIPLSEYCQDMEANCTANLKAAEMFGDTVDGVHVGLYSPDNLPSLWLTEVKVPGRELGDDAPWQLYEKELVKQSDYDKILEMGFDEWYRQFLVEKLDNPVAKAQNFIQYIPTAMKRFAEAGLPVINGGSFCSPFEMFCGGRSLTKFLIDDLLEIPEKVEEVFKVVHESRMKGYEQKLKNAGGKMFGCWIGGWRGTPEMLSPEMFEKFSWKYMREMADLMISYNVTPIFHLDSNWTLGLKYFKDLPKGKCIMQLDGKTDIFKAKEVIGDQMCIMGDVPAELLAFGKPERVREYCGRLVREIGPVGYMMSSGCDMPYNATLENIQIMAQSVLCK